MSNSEASGESDRIVPAVVAFTPVASNCRVRTRRVSEGQSKPLSLAYASRFPLNAQADLVGFPAEPQSQQMQWVEVLLVNVQQRGIGRVG